MAERNGFIVHEESFRNFERLSDERLGRLFRAMYRYASGEPAQAFPEDEVLDIIFENIRERMDRDAVRYEETCKARSEAGKKGGRPKKANGFSEKAKKANGFFEKQTKAKKLSVSVIVIVIVIVNVILILILCVIVSVTRVRARRDTQHTRHGR